MTTTYCPIRLAWLVVREEHCDLGGVAGWLWLPVSGLEHGTEDDARAELRLLEEGP